MIWKSLGPRPAFKSAGHLGAMLLRDQVERFLVHRAGGVDLFTVGSFFVPAKAVKAPVLDARIAFQPLFQQPRQGALGAADRAVQEQHAPLGPVPLAALIRMLTRFTSVRSRPKMASWPSFSGSSKNL